MSIPIRLINGDDAALASYESWVHTHPDGSLWQSLAWKKYQEALGREVRIYVAEKNQESNDKNQDFRQIAASALVVIDKTAGGFSTWEIPRGPLWSGEVTAHYTPPSSLRPAGHLSPLRWREESQVKSTEVTLLHSSGEGDGMRTVTGNEQLIQHFLETIIADAKKERAVAVYFSPFVNSQFSITCPSKPWRSGVNCQLSPRHVHAEATRIIDLAMSEQEILGQMHPKGRYNISLASRNGVTVRQGSTKDVDSFYEMLKSTARRDGFQISQKSHYARFLTDLEGSFIQIAEKAGKPIAGLIGVIWNSVGIYYYGASSYGDRQLMAPYLLQWEAIRFCKSKGCTKYDLLGIEPAEKLQAKRLWAGISEFKRKFGGTVVNYPAEQMIVLRPWIYRALQMKRKLLG